MRVGIVTGGDLLRAVLRTDGDIERAVRRETSSGRRSGSRRGRSPWPSRTAW
ncbi:hypothetical protein ACFT1B_10655 [Streptomyces griseoincarnatus]|uniref:hypothetical protein n=1 Tax=Streptomyces TaxID=1883 RepID=UPI001FD406BA|nr:MULTISPECIES: hypothetical protein [Streptomyces]